MVSLSIRLALFLFCLFLSLASLYFEFVVGLKPCALCIMQRLVVFILSFNFLFLSLSKSRQWQKRFFVSALLFALAGIYFAARQVYLQSLPPELAASCGPNLNVLIDYFPLKDVLKALFWGSGSCAKVTWSFLSFSMASWCLLAFIFIFIVCGFVLYLEKKIALVNT